MTHTPAASPAASPAADITADPGTSPATAPEDATAPASRAAVVEDLFAAAGPTGLTWKEFDAAAGWGHHGRSTAALSAAHKNGRLARLTERRDRCSVYVLTEHLNGRDTIPHGPRTTSKVPAAAVADLTARNDELFTALDNLAHAAGFRTHRHVWVDEAEKCFLCIARRVVAEEAARRNPTQTEPRRITTGATLDADKVAS